MRILSNNKFRQCIFCWLLLLVSFSVAGQGLPVTSPEEVGLSSVRLNRITNAMNDWTSEGKMPGMVTLGGPAWESCLL